MIIIERNNCNKCRFCCYVYARDDGSYVTFKKCSITGNKVLYDFKDEQVEIPGCPLKEGGADNE